MPEVGEIEEIVRARFWMVDLLFLEINSFHFFVIKKTAKIFIGLATRIFNSSGLVS